MASYAENDGRNVGSSSKDGDAEEHCSYAMQLASSSVLPMVMLAAVELDLLEIIDKAGPTARLSPPEIASRLPTGNPEAPAVLDRILQLLTSFSVLTCTLSDTDPPCRLYGLAPVAKYFIRNQDGASLGPFLALLQDRVFIDSWYQLKDAVLEGGIPFNRVHGSHAFEYPDKDPRFNEVFNKAMVNQTAVVIKTILQSYNGFEHIKKLVDVGGGLGVTLNIITSNYPAIQGINFDLPHVIKHGPAYLGVQHVGGDMFESIPKGDAIFMKWILHDWSDDHCLKLLKNCHKALPDNGMVIVVEGILPAVPNSSTAVKSLCQKDMLMLTQNPGGRERTEQEFLALATGAGFSGIRLVCFTCNFWVMEFYK